MSTAVYWFWLLTLLAAMQLLGQWWPFVAIPTILVLATIVSFTTTTPWRYVLMLALGGELFSLLPAAFLAVSICIPLLLMSVPRRPHIDVSGWFFTWILLTSCTQIGILVAGLWWQARVSLAYSPWHTWWQFVPTYVPAAAGILTAVAFGAIILWHELVAPHQVQRTIPRFKGLS